MKVYDGASWITATSAGATSLLRFRYVATSGQTTFSGADSASATLTYTVNNIEVMRNGVTLDTSEYTASNGTSIVLTVAAGTGDIIDIIAFKSFTVADALSAVSGGTVNGAVTITGVTTVQAGSAAAPAITTTGDTNTGIFFPAADTIAFSEGGAEAARFDSSGNLGIGTTAPGYRLEVKGPAATAGQLSIHDGTGDTVTSGNNAGSLLFQARDSSVRTIAEIDGVHTTTNGTGGAMVFQTRISDTLAERMRIDSSGNLLVGKTVTTETVTGVNITAGGQIVCNSSADPGVFYRPTTNAGFGVIVTKSDIGGTNTAVGVGYANGTFGVISDINKKKNVQDARGYLNDLMQIRVVKYNWKTDEEDAPKELGWIAQEVEQVFPGMVNEMGDSKFLKKEVFLPMLLKAIQEQQVLITALTARITALENK
jgi:hypothetical protein